MIAFSRKNINSWKAVNIIVAVATLLGIYITNYYLEGVCLEVGDCNIYTRLGFWRPVLQSLLFLLPIFTIFLVLPAEYFRRYILHWFWWISIIAFLMIAGTKPIATAIVSLDRSQVVFVWGVVAILLTALFLVRSYIARSNS